MSLSSDRFGCDTQIRSFAGKYSFNEMGGDCSYSGVSEHDKIALLQEWMG